MSEIIGQGMSYPIRVNGRGGLSWASGDEAIQQSIWIILTTPLRSRVMQPTFGCAIHDYLFAPNSSATRTAVEEAVRDALIRWEPRVEVQRVRAATAPESETLLLVDIETRKRSNNAALNLVYPFYLTEGMTL
ncbi:baseplate protein [Nitrincola sp. A-D6]|uniref:GPW/gp25 family protein n=1 Tax=Nitrincola sp. A-D6 TaxID=1545442 RepID=UPI00051FC15A|nr:GPW/gp25 family protein [Nitrincola sp. A-D6]KGK41987.1 baseplate protein [Nitrincola sp. A-D6]